MARGTRRPLFRAAGFATLLLAAGIAYLAVTPLGLPDHGHAKPEWIGPVQVADVVSGTIWPDRMIRISDGRIAEIAAADALDAETRRRAVNIAGAHVVPGLWDMHAILLRYAPALDFPLHLAHGVTRLRNIVNCSGGGAVELHPCQADKRAWAAAVSRGGMAGPITMGSGSYPLNGPGRRPAGLPEVFDAATPEQAREMVRLIATQPNRPDHLKAYDRLPRDSYFAMVDEAKRLGIEVSGHVPHAIAVAEAAAAGHKAVAHARVLVLACSSREAETMELRTNRAPQATWMALAMDSFDPEICQALWSELAARGTFVSPTLITRHTETAAGLSALLSDPEAGHYTPALIGLIQLEDVSAVKNQPAGTQRIFERFYQDSARRVADAERAGVRLLTGTDTYEVGVIPGLGLHHEMALWQDAGIPAASILRAATMNAAAYFGLETTHGQVLPGHAADLVFVAGNPLEDIGVLRRPVAVMQEGRLYDRARLDAMLGHARNVAGGWRFTVHLLRDMIRNPAGFVR